MSSLAYFIKQAYKGYTRNLSTTLGSIITIFLSLFIIGVFLVGAIVVDNIVKSVESEVSITAYVSDDAKQTDINAMEDYIKGLDGVANVSFTTKEQSLEDFRNMSSNADTVDELGVSDGRDADVIWIGILELSEDLLRFMLDGINADVGVEHVLHRGSRC